ncbi:MAG: hypothetical protein VX938_04075, partial [Myxococcota bacterium]|nr:hypothetical protein [Myxococcota bacterium]
MTVRFFSLLCLALVFGACSASSDGSGSAEETDVGIADGDVSEDGAASPVDASVPVEGPCDGLLEGDPCDSDGDQCSLEVCDGEGICVATGEFETCAEASAQYPCWTYVCVGKSGCVSTNFIEGLSCDDGVPCTKNDTCTTNDMGQEACIGEPIPVDDGNDCTNDACADGVVTHEPIDGAPCEAVDACGSEGTCEDGACVSLTPCGCEEDADCDDGMGC